MASSPLLGSHAVPLGQIGHFDRKEPYMKNKSCAIAILVTVACLNMSAASSAPVEQALVVTPDKIQWVDLPGYANAKLAVIEGKMDKTGPLTFRIKFPADTKVPAHFHPGVERTTILSGTFNLGMGDKLDPAKTTPLGPGSMVIMPPKMHHFGWTKEETVIQVNVTGPWGITYINPADDPRKK